MNEFHVWLAREMGRYAWVPPLVARWTSATEADVVAWLHGLAVPTPDQLRCLSLICREDLLWLLRITGWLRDTPQFNAVQERP